MTLEDTKPIKIDAIRRIQLDSLGGKPILFFVIFLVLFFFGVVILENTFDTAEEIDTTRDINGSELVLSNNATENSLSQIPTTSDATKWNQTWIDFDGTDDNLTVPDDSYLTVSYWYRNSTIDWQNVINSSGTTYVNGSLASPDISPVFTDGSIWVFGMEDESTFIEVSIDEIRFYNGTINSTIAQEIYDARR